MCVLDRFSNIMYCLFPFRAHVPFHFDTFQYFGANNKGIFRTQLNNYDGAF